MGTGGDVVIRWFRNWRARRRQRMCARIAVLWAECEAELLAEIERKVEVCPECFGDGFDGTCQSCDGKGTITHGPFHPCSFCGASRCGGGCCQAYCVCHGYWDYYIRPYEEENARGET